MRPRIGDGQNPFYFFNRTRPLSERYRDAGITMLFDVDKVLAPPLRRKIGYI
jgi:hypothetical protein